MADKEKDPKAQGNDLEHKETPPAVKPNDGDDLYKFAEKKAEELNKDKVDRSLYEKALQQSQDLVSRMLKGEKISVNVDTSKPDEDPIKAKSDQEIRKSVFSGGKTNLEFWKNSIELRKREIAKGRPDPWCRNGIDQYGNKLEPENGEVEAMDKFQKDLEDSIADANGDPQIFDKEIMRRGYKI